MRSLPLKSGLWRDSCPAFLAENKNMIPNDASPQGITTFSRYLITPVEGLRGKTVLQDIIVILLRNGRKRSFVNIHLHSLISDNSVNPSTGSCTIITRTVADVLNTCIAKNIKRQETNNFEAEFFSVWHFCYFSHQKLCFQWGFIFHIQWSEKGIGDMSFKLWCCCLNRRLFISALLMVVMALPLQWKRSSYYKSSRHSIFWTELHTAKSTIRELITFFQLLAFFICLFVFVLFFFNEITTFFSIIVMEVSTKHLQTLQPCSCWEPLIGSLEEIRKNFTVINLWSKCWWTLSGA